MRGIQVGDTKTLLKMKKEKTRTQLVAPQILRLDVESLGSRKASHQRM